MSLTRKLTSPLTRPVAIASGATAESDNVVLSGGYKSFTPTFVGDKSIKFDGTDDAVDTGFQPDFIHTNATMAYWVNMDDLSGAQLCGTHNAKRFYLGFYNATAGMGVQDQNNLGSGADLSSLIAVNQWHHIAMVADGGTATFYLDGVARDTMSYTQNSANNPNANLYIGAKSNSGTYDDFINGSVDEFAVFSSALTAREVDALYNNGQPTNLSSYSTLEAWYRMGEGKLGTKSDGDENLLFDQGPNGGLGSEKVTNGSFSADSDWTKGTGWTISGGVASIDGSQSAGQFLYQNAGLVTDKVYEVTFDVVTRNAGLIRVIVGGNTTGAWRSSTGTFTEHLKSSNGANFFLQTDADFNGSIDNVSVKEVQNVGTIIGARIQADGGTELVTNGTFDTDVSGWSAAGNGALSYQNGVLRVTTSGGVGSANQVIALSSGATFTLTFDVVAETQSSGTPFFQVTSGLANTGITSTGTQTIVVTASSDNPTLTFSLGGAATNGEYIEIDNVSVKEVTESVPKKTQNLPSAGSAKSLSFDGTDDTASVPFELPTGTWTVSQWIKINDTSASDDIYVWESRDASHTSGNIMHPIKASASTYKNRWWNAGAFRISPTTEYPIGLWQHVVFVKDEGTGTMYVDGEAVGTATGFSTTADNAPNMFIGARYSNEYHRLMEVDELAIWDTALDGDAIRALYNAGLPTPVTTKTGAYDIYRDNLKAYYKMGDATNPAADGTSNLLFDQTSPGVGPELITNGTFDSDVSGWSAYSGGTVTWNNGTAITGAVGTDDRGGMTQTLTTVTGAVYQVSFDILSRTSTKWEIYNQTGGATLIEGTALGSHSTFFTAAGTSTQFSFYAKQAGTSDGTVAWDNISVKQVNGHTGTISGATIQTEAPKAIYALPPVANTKSIDFDGTNDHLVTQVDDTLQPNNESRYYSWWYKSPSSAGTKETVFSHGAENRGMFAFDWNSNRNLLYMASSVLRYWNSNSKSSDNAWHHWVVKIVANDITACELWCDGEKQTVNATTNSGSMNTYTSGITIGAGLDNSRYLEGSIDEFSIHEELDEEAIRALFNRGRPIDISKSQGAYDLSDKALHWWRMGDATSPAADGTNDIIFQGLEAEDSELLTNGDFSDDSVPDTWNGSAAVNLAGWTSGGATFTADAHFVITDGKCRLISDGTNTVINSGTTVAGKTYRYSIDLTDVTSGGLTLIGGGQVLEANATSPGTYTGFYTATSATSAISINRQSGVTDFTVDNVSVKQVRGQYIGAELVKADGDLYKAATWTTYGGNVETFPNGTAARFDRPSTGGDTRGGYVSLNSSEALTSNLETGCVYKLQFDFLTDDSDAFPRYYDGSSYTNLSAGSGLKVHYFAFSGSGFINVDDLTADKFVQFSNLSLTKVGGAAVLTNMDSASDIQTDTPY